MPDKKFELERVMDSLATISEIIFKRLQTMECNQCEPCGQIFMKALTVLRESGNVTKGSGPGSAGGQH